MKYLIVGWLILSPLFIKAQNFNRPVPDRFTEYEFVKQDTSYHGVYLSTPFFAKGSSPYDRSLAILDENGYLLWYSLILSGAFTDFKYHPKHELYSFIHRINGKMGYFKIMDLSFNVIDSITNINGFTIASHEFQVLENGNYVIAGKTDSIVDLSDYTLNGVQGSDTTHIRGFTIQEFDHLSHNLLFEWNSNDHIDPTEAYESNYGYNIGDFDYCHGNAIEKDLDSNYLISFRHTNSIYKIDKNSGNTIWKLGGKVSDFVFVNDVGFSGQHDIRRLSNGNVSLFDNGNMSTSQTSRAVEYKLDTVNWTATKVWEYVYNPAFITRAMGNNQTTNDNYHLINYGQVNRPNPSFVLIDHNDNVMSELFYRDSVLSYRSFTYDDLKSFHRPEINCSNNGTIILTAPSGYDSYLWSTGEVSASITVSEIGTYQLWVNKGIGMLGSLPVQIDDMTTFCKSTTIAEGYSFDSKNFIIYRIYDLLGREVHIPIDNHIYIIQYNDGRVMKELWKKERIRK